MTTSFQRSHTARFCPICDSNSSRPVHRHTFARVSGDLGLDGYTVVICGRCGFAFADDIPGQADFDKYYAYQSKYQTPLNAQSSNYDQARFKEIVDHLIRCGSDVEDSVLDVGCATGGLLVSLKQRGWRRLKGIDPSEACAQMARDHFDLDVSNQSLDSLISHEERFDVITLVGVLEHVRDLRALLRKVSLLLKPAGMIYVASPDIETFLKCSNAPFQQFSTEHINFFSKISLRNLGSACGMRAGDVYQWITQWSASVTDSVVSMVMYADTIYQEPEPDTVSAVALADYIRICAAQVEELRQRIEEIAGAEGTLLIWGAGSNARFLWSAGAFRGVSVSAFVDRNSFLHGATIDNVPIISPASITGRSETIIICSKAFQSEIVADIRKLGISNRIYCLYDV